MMTMMVQMMAYLKILELELLMTNWSLTMIWRMQLTDDDYDISQMLSLRVLCFGSFGS